MDGVETEGQAATTDSSRISEGLRKRQACGRAGQQPWPASGIARSPGVHPGLSFLWGDDVPRITQPRIILDITLSILQVYRKPERVPMWLPSSCGLERQGQWKGRASRQ